MMIAALPTNEADPVRRLERAHEAMRVAKDRHDAVPANLIQDMTRYAPPAIAGLAARLVGAVTIDDMASPPFNLTISNVPGPRHAVYCGGARLVANYPLSVISEGVGLHISLVTYDDEIHIGLVACREALPGHWDLVDDIVASLHELRAAVLDAAPLHRRGRRTRKEEHDRRDRGRGDGGRASGCTRQIQPGPRAAGDDGDDTAAL